MLITFESDVGRITMFGDIGAQLIRMLGRSGTVPGALLAAEVPEALGRLRQTLESCEEPPAGTAAKEEGEEEDRRPKISLRQRAFPLIKLLEDAAKHGSDVMWEEIGSRPLQF